MIGCLYMWTVDVPIGVFVVAWCGFCEFAFSAFVLCFVIVVALILRVWCLEGFVLTFCGCGFWCVFGLWIVLSENCQFMFCWVCRYDAVWWFMLCLFNLLGLCMNVFWTCCWNFWLIDLFGCFKVFLIRFCICLRFGVLVAYFQLCTFICFDICEFGGLFDLGICGLWLTLLSWAT